MPNASQREVFNDQMGHHATKVGLSPVQRDGGPDLARVLAHGEELRAVAAQVVDLARVGALVRVARLHRDQEGAGGGVLGDHGGVKCPGFCEI